MVPIKQKITNFFSNKRLRVLSMATIILGIVLRCIFYLQNRCLFIDEANVARNIYERSFKGLTQPLSYEQYAPPVFLWIIKCFTLGFGYSEFAYRAFPFICGIASLWLLWLVLKKFTSYTAAWYPLLMVATGFIYIRYSAELKQYICDTDVALLLLLAALNIDVLKTKWIKFLLVWGLIGSVTVWLSMPGVFVLAGVGMYYLYIVLQNRNWGKAGMLVALAGIWLCQFVLYYLVILKPQINSDYLQNCHKDFFLYFIPGTMEKLNHNADVLIKLISAMGGKWTIPVVLHILCLCVGLGYLFYKHTSKAILITVPVIALLLAAATNQYALTPRLVLFIMPILLVIITVGLEQMLMVKFVVVRAIFVIACVLSFYLSNTFDLFYTRHDNEQITESLNYLNQQKIDGKHLLVHDLAKPAYIYYTTIHPNKAAWHSLVGGTLLFWNTNYDSLGQTFSERTALLYSWEEDDKVAHQRAEIEKHHQQEAEHIVTGGRVYIYKKK